MARTEAQLRARLAAETRLTAASTFRTLSDTERFVAQGLRANQAVVKAWAKTAAVGQKTAITFDAGRTVGVGVLRSTNALQNMSRLTIVIKKVQASDRVYFILTAYPKL